MSTKPKKVMLIDDNEVDLKINSKIITLSNLFEDIIICHSGEEGLLYLKNHVDQQELLPDFILLDIQMPEMDGFEFLEFYKRLSNDITDKCLVAILSSTLDFGDIQRAEANPQVIRLLKKPLMPAELKEILDKYI
ncbi:two-component response regulator [Pedobacter sp. BAL39]|uniref:response regulator n=1 Tax=Pedobacter sp. BAL39 TaxID=391596 RepID=UPI0001559CF8|nr:response regulator [Pedobacter sp. BAL39]EDM36534.1 two-component response regulator [Pedobacter sp. BAL39]